MEPPASLPESTNQGCLGLQESFEELDTTPLKMCRGLPYKTPYTIPKSTISYDVSGKNHVQFLHQSGDYGWQERGLYETELL